MKTINNLKYERLQILLFVGSVLIMKKYENKVN